MTIQEKNKIVIAAFVKIMEQLGQGTWTVLPIEEARKLPGDSSAPDAFIRGSYSVGYFHQFITGKVAEYCEVFVAARVSDEDPAFELYTFEHHPGSFNPRDGGTPPETEEVFLSTFGSLEQALKQVIEIWSKEIVNNYFENVWEEEAAKHSEEN